MAWLAERHGFPGLAAVGKVKATREIDGKATTACRCYILSKPLSAARFLTSSAPTGRSRTACIGFSTSSWTRTSSAPARHNGPENLARLRRFALNIIRANQDKGSTRGKIKHAAWDDAFLLQLLAAA